MADCNYRLAWGAGSDRGLGGSTSVFTGDGAGSVQKGRDWGVRMVGCGVAG